MVKIYCPNCRRILGDTNTSIDANLNCPGCRKTVKIKLKVATMQDFLENTNQKGSKND